MDTEVDLVGGLNYDVCFGNVQTQRDEGWIQIFGGGLFLHESESRICLWVFVSVIAMKLSHINSAYLFDNTMNNSCQSTPERAYDLDVYART